MESAAVLRSFHCITSPLKTVFEKPGVVSMNNASSSSLGKFSVHGLAYGGKLISSPNTFGGIIVACAKTSEAAVTTKSDGDSNGAVMPDSSQNRSVQKNSPRRATFPNGFEYLHRGSPVNVQSRNFSSLFRRKDELSIEEEAERKVGWLLKLIFAGTATVVGYQFFRITWSVSLLQVKDPLFKRMGASRLARFAIDDERRLKIIEMGGAQGLLNMLETSKDNRTRKEALKALDAISKSDDAVGALKQAGAMSVISSTPDSAEDDEVKKYKLNLMNRFEDLRYA